MTGHSVDLALLVLRVGVGVVFLAHGINHVFGGGKIAGTGRWFESLGMRPGWLHAWTASLTEVGAGALLLLGLLTPVAGAGVVGVMLVAWITNHARKGFFIFRPGEGYEYVLNLAIACFAIACVGAGQWSIDDKINFQLHHWWGLIAALIVGVGGTVALLVTFWRPPAPKPAES